MTNRHNNMNKTIKKKPGVAAAHHKLLGPVHGVVVVWILCYAMTTTTTVVDGFSVPLLSVRHAVGSPHFGGGRRLASRTTSTWRRAYPNGEEGEQAPEPNPTTTTTTRPSSVNLGLPLVWTLPPLVSLSSFVTFSWTVHLFHSVFHVVDNESSSSLLLPILNGPILGACSILFATLTAMTIGTLYNRQLQIRQGLVNELEELRQLALYIASLTPPPTTTKTRTRTNGSDNDLEDDTDQTVLALTLEAQRQATLYLEQHVHLLLQRDTLLGKPRDEQQLLLLGGPPDDTQGCMIRASTAIRDTGMDPLTSLLNDLLHANNAAQSGKDVVPDTLVSQMYTSIQRIHSFRSQFQTFLQTKFPPIHYIILAWLVLCLATIFLLETASVTTANANASTSTMTALESWFRASSRIHIATVQQEEELRTMWTLLWTVFALIASVVYDLATPFTGTYVIFASTRPQEQAVRRYVLEPIDSLSRSSSFTSRPAPPPITNGSAAASSSLGLDTPPESLVRTTTAMVPPQQQQPSPQTNNEVPE